MSTLQRVRPVMAERSSRRFVRELVKFGLVGTAGTVITVVGANLMHTWLGDSPVTSTLVPTVVSTLFSYAANRHWTFRHRDSNGTTRDLIIFFGLNAIAATIQALCTGLTYYTLNLHDTLSYNAGLIAGLTLASTFRYWSYQKWVFTPTQ